jgi:tetratricopeptide (TPR) repeat protein
LPEEEAEPHNFGYYLLALCLYLCALLSKTVTCSLPAALLLILWWKRGRILRQDVIRLAPYFLAGIMLALITVWIERYGVGARGEQWTLSFAERCLVAGRALWFYAQKLVWPHRLTFIYPRWQVDGGVWWQYLYPLSAAAVLAVLVLLRQRIGRGPAVAGLFFAGTLLPALGFIDVYPMQFSFVADHFQYLASIGLLVLCVSTATAVFRKQSLWLSRTGTAAATAVLLMLGMLVWQQTKIYTDEETLWRDTLLKNPEAWIAHTNLGMVFAGQGKTEAAMAHYRDALRIRPDFEKAHNNLGAALAGKGRLDEAVRHFKKALLIKPDFAEAHNNLGIAYARQRENLGAVVHFKEALRFKPDSALPHHHLGLVLARLGKFEDAVAHYRQALQLRPDLAEARKGLQYALTKLGRQDRPPKQ